MKSFDIDTVAACDAGAEIELTDPITNERTGQFVGIVGSHGKTWLRITDKYNDAERRRQFAAQKRNKVAEPRTGEELRREAVEMLAAASTSFRTVEYDDMGEVVPGSERPSITLDGQELTFSEANAIKLYTKRPVYKQQVDEGVANLENFIKG